MEVKTCQNNRLYRHVDLAEARFGRPAASQVSSMFDMFSAALRYVQVLNRPSLSGPTFLEGGTAVARQAVPQKCAREPKRLKPGI
jgi:hypothetical protein